MTITVEIERGEEVGLAGAQVERRREQPEVGDIDVPVAVDVAEEAEEALGVAEGKVVAGRAVAKLATLRATTQIANL